MSIPQWLSDLKRLACAAEDGTYDQRQHFREEVAAKGRLLIFDLCEALETPKVKRPHTIADNYPPGGLHEPTDREMQMAEENEKLADELAALRADLDAARQQVTAMEKLIEAIDVAVMPASVAAEHTRDVGGPVSGYLIAYTENTVLQHVKDALAERDRQIQALREGIEQIQSDAREAGSGATTGIRAFRRMRGACLGIAADCRHILAAPVPAPAPAPDDENRRLREALEASAETKRAYMGEFSFSIDEIDEDGNEYYRGVTVPWTTIKEIMAAIRARAALAPAKGAGEADDDR